MSLVALSLVLHVHVGIRQTQCPTCDDRLHVAADVVHLYLYMHVYASVNGVTDVHNVQCTHPSFFTMLSLFMVDCNAQ